MKLIFAIMGPTIFISIASYLDPLLMFTLQQAFDKAKYPGCIYAGVVDQHVENHRQDIGALPYAARIRYIHLKPQDTHGVSWARSLAFSLYDNESFLLQIDSHTLFEQDWDEILLKQYWEMLGRSSKPILTTYPFPFTWDGDVPQYSSNPETVLVLRPTPEATLNRNNLVIGFHGRHLYVQEPVLGCHIAGGFIFTSGSFINEVPYDPFVYFLGEEQNLAIRAYTRGWDIYHPVTVPLRHYYKEFGVSYDTHHWHGEIEKQRDYSFEHLRDRSLKRMNALLSGEGGFGAYDLGKERSLKDFTELSGIDYKRCTITDPFNGQLC